MANREEHTDVIEAMKRLSVGALCTVKTDGVDDADVEWATPSELERAAMRLRELVLAGHPDTKRILEIYAKSANAVDPIDEEFDVTWRTSQSSLASPHKKGHPE
jgi:hypothetical protein